MSFDLADRESIVDLLQRISLQDICPRFIRFLLKAQRRKRLRHWNQMNGKSKFDFPVLKALGIDVMPFGNNLVLIGLPGVGKSVFCGNLAGECLRKGVNVVYVAVDASPKEIRDRVLEQCPEGSRESGVLTFVDGYSWLLGEADERHRVAHLSNLNDLSVKISSAIKECDGDFHVVLFDSISTLFLHNSESDITRFLQVNMARIKQSGGMGIWTVEEGIHTISFYNTLRHLADGVVEMRLEEDRELRRFVRVHTLRGLSHRTNWLPFTVQQRGEFSIDPMARLRELTPILIA